MGCVGAVHADSVKKARATRIASGVRSALHSSTYLANDKRVVGLVVLKLHREAELLHSHAQGSAMRVSNMILQRL